MEDLQIVQQCAHWALVQTAVYSHVQAARQQKWAMPQLLPPPADIGGSGSSCSGNGISDVSVSVSSENEDYYSMTVSGMTPYWISRLEAVHNSVEFTGVTLLTGSNMSGKSTLMRAALVTALLANCGLFVPAAEGTAVPRFDTYFLRTASYDVPSEAKSAFALEMEDVRVILRDCSRRSLVMIDELGKGTSARDGAALAGALLEHLSSVGCVTVFATHLHELFSLPLDLRRAVARRMGVRVGEHAGGRKWTYKLEEGRCSDSQALLTAREFGIREDLLMRAEALGSCFDRLCRPRFDEICTETEIKGTRDSKDRKIKRRGSRRSSEVETVNDDEEQSAAVQQRVQTLESLQPILQSHMAQYSIVEADCLPPLALEGESCVYILQIQSTLEKLYVGETESIAQRLAQHRSTYRGLAVRAAVSRVGSKSAARAAESGLIRALLSRGYSLENSGDQRHVLFGAATAPEILTGQLPASGD